MMTPQSLLLASSSLLILLLHFSQAKKHHCTSSACGIIGDIKSPLRLKNYPKYCGFRDYELACENNVTSVYLNSQKFYVKAINYSNSTIRMVDASINNDDICSFPTFSAYDYNFTYNSLLGYTSPYSIPRSSSYPYNYLPPCPIHFISCPHLLKNKNSSLFTDSTDCASNGARYTSIKVGHMNASELPETCELEVIATTSWQFKDLNNVSLSEIHHSLLYGFELKFCGECGNPVSELEVFFVGRLNLSLVILLVIAVVLSAGVGPPGMTIIVFTGGLGLISFGVFKFDRVFEGMFLQLLIGVISAARFIIFPFVMWFLIYKFRRRHWSIFEEIESFLQSDNKLMPIRYSYSDIKKMTKGFQEKLGEGGYGYVYKGKLRSGNDVAVKLLGKSGANGQDFINEIATIGRIHHVNVVKLIGYCAERSKRALVFDFMPNGSLEKYIFNQEKMNLLNWDKRFDIAVGVARGIEYLHRGCDIQILHFDIKPHNVLLDDNFIPKISDFGLAKYFSTEKNSVTLTAARGTIGYVAPELINRSIGVVSYKADVYSFGMLLMEIVGLKRDLIGKGNNEDSSKYFPYWIYDHFNQGKHIEIGNTVENGGDHHENDSIRKLAQKMTIVALWCIRMSPDDRPSMSKVLEMLEADVERLQIPEYPSQSTQFVENMDQTGTTCSTDSTLLLHHDDASQPSVEITIQE